MSCILYDKANHDILARSETLKRIIGYKAHEFNLNLCLPKLISAFFFEFNAAAFKCRYGHNPDILKEIPESRLAILPDRVDSDFALLNENPEDLKSLEFTLRRLDYQLSDCEPGATFEFEGQTCTGENAANFVNAVRLAVSELLIEKLQIGVRGE